MKAFHYITLLIFLIPLSSVTQTTKFEKILVLFKDKTIEEFNPYNYFDIKAIKRREIQCLPLFDYRDLPVNQEYINNIINIVDSIKLVSRWMNGVVCYANKEQKEKLIQLPCLMDIETLNSSYILANNSEKSISIEDLNYYEKLLLDYQTNRLGIKEFEAGNFDGKGIRIAIFDAGFLGVDTHIAFSHILKESRIIKTYDFVKRSENVYKNHIHGTMVMSCIAGKISSYKIGMATGAEFLLARTENARREPFSEEENWLAAAEWADKNGADIINSSLGYANTRYFSFQMDGKTSLVSRAAGIAASKGILVINAAGNEGSAKWHHIVTPADNDSVLTVGAINPATNFHTEFSSYGPTTDKRIKPNVISTGHAIVADKNGLSVGQGTSFASPLVAGFAACAWQTNPSLTNMELHNEIQKSGDLFPYFDYAHGFGVPQAKHFTTQNNKNDTTFDLTISGNILTINIRNHSLPNKNINENHQEILSFLLKKPVCYENYFYYHIENNNGYLDSYYVIEVRQANVVEINLSNFKKGQVLRFHFSNHTASYKI